MGNIGTSTKEIIIILLLVLFSVWILCPFYENFEGLRGEIIPTSTAKPQYMSPYRQIMLNQGGGEKWQSDRTPPEEGFSGCYKVQCPVYEYGYDNMDTCWQCTIPPLNNYDHSNTFPSFCIY